MKRLLSHIALIFLIALEAYPQQNNSLRGKVLFLNSGGKPAVGVEIGGSLVRTGESANPVSSTDDGTYQLIFPNARDGYLVDVKVGERDRERRKIELVNEREVQQCQIPADAWRELKIIVCPEGAREEAALRYYHIIKESSQKELEKMSQKVKSLWAQEKVSLEKIKALEDKMHKLRQQNDSLQIYQEAFKIASINKDFASKRVLKYLQLLDEGKSIQEARKALSKEKAKLSMEKGLAAFEAGIEELEIRAKASLRLNDIDDATECYEAIIQGCENFKFIDKIKVSDYLVVLGKIYHINGNYNASLKKYEKSLAYLKSIFPQCRHPKCAPVYTGIALNNRHLASYEEAIEYLKKAMQIDKEFRRTKDLAITYHNLGTTYYVLGKYELSTSYLKNAIGILENRFHPTHYLLGRCYNSISLSLGAQKQYIEALKYQEKAFFILKSSKKPNKFSLASSHNNRASLYLGTKKYKEALVYQEKAIKFYENYGFRNHPELATCYSNMSIIQSALNNRQRALEYGLKSLKIREAIFGFIHPSTANSYHNIGIVYSDSNEHEISLTYFNKALEIQKEVWGYDSPN